MRFRFVAIAPALLLAPVSFPSAAAEHALVIGNGSYETLERLDSAKNDAQRLAQILRDRGFEVALATDATNGGMRAAIQSFAEGLAAGDTAVVYFSGHAFQSQGRNYLLPVTANLRSEIDLSTQAIALNGILSLLQRQPLRVGFVILDAAYKTEFIAANRIKPGIAAIEPGERNLVIFLAAPPDEVNAIRPGPSSVFGRALLTQMSQGDPVVGTLVSQISDSVSQATGGAQKPWSRSTLAGTTSLKEPEGVKAVAPLQARAPQAAEYSLQDLITLDSTFAREERMRIQHRLQEMGFYKDEIDGVFGMQTRQAIRAYQETKGAERTGYLTPGQLNELF